LVAEPGQLRLRPAAGDGTALGPEEGPQPDLQVDRPPDEGMLLQAVLADGVERVGDCQAVPVGPGAEERRAKQALDPGSLGLEPAELGRGEADLPAAKPDLLG